MKNIETQNLVSNLGEIASSHARYPQREIFLSSLTVEESTPGAVIGILSCTGDKADITYEIIIGDTSKFEIIGNHLKLKNDISLKFSNQNVYNLSIEASTPEEGVVTKTFVIQVKDSENSHIAQAATFNVIAGHPALNASVGMRNDGTGNPLSYSLVGKKPSGLAFHSDGSFSFDPSHSDYQHLENGEILPVIFSYHVNDGASDSNIAIVTINLVGQKAFPNIKSDTFDIMEYAPVIADSIHSKNIDNGAILSYSLMGKVPFKISSFVNMALSASILYMPFFNH